MSWPVVLFDDIIKDVSAQGEHVPQSDYLLNGKYPVVDQGKSFIAGYSDDGENLASCGLPVVLFGDHTRCWKYIDFDFCIGADGVKLLKPINQAQLYPKYIYYFLQQVHLPDVGYSRHFKYLRRLEIPLPPLPEQQRIAAILDKADALRQKRREALAQLDRLLQAVFVEIFGDPVTNPKGWPERPLGDLLSFLTSGSRGWAAYYADSGKIFLRIQNVGRGRMYLDDLTYVNAPESAEARRTRVQPGDVLFSITADLGRSAVVPEWMDEGYINQHLAILRSSATDPYYLSAFLSSPASQRQVQQHNKGGVKAGLNFDDIRSLQILVPPMELQRNFALMVSKIESIRSKYEVAQTEADALFSSLQTRAFAGEL